VSAGWVAGSVRARLLLERRLGATSADRLARQPSLDGALSMLANTPYGSAASSPAGLEEVQRQVVACTALDLRVLAAWLPRGAAVGLRALAAWFELANMEDRLAYLAGEELRPPFELGVLSSVWEAAETTQSPAELRALLRSSTWGDPGSDAPQELELGLRFAWARRVAAQVPEARAWVDGAVAILLAQELLVTGRRVEPALLVRLGLGSSWSEAGTLGELRARLPSRVGWALEGIDEPADLWRAQLAWWRTVGAEAETMVRRRREGRPVVVAAVVLLGLDALRVVTALAVAARGSSSPAREVLDALG